MEEIRKGNELDLTVEKLTFGGKAMARVNGFVVFIEQAVPGQKLRVRITRKKRQYAEAQTVAVLSQSPLHVEPFCRHFGICGGCRWQNLPYEEQLHWKRTHVLECLAHLEGVQEALAESTVASPQTQYYRNKMEFTFSSRRWLSPQEIAATEVRYSRSFALGLHARGAFNKVFNLDECYLESPQSVAILRETRQWCRDSGLAAYNTLDHQGFWRFLVIREGKRTAQTLLHIITAGHAEQDKVVDDLAQHLLDRFPQITTIVHSVSRKKAQVAVGDASRVVMGPGFIEEIVGNLRFQISAHSFFQTNPQAAEKLYESIAGLAELSGRETVWDLYCGTGSIAIGLAARVQRVVGFEVVEEAVVDAYRNCQVNGIENCFFRTGDLKDSIKEARTRTSLGPPPEVVVTDPPRSGMHPRVVQAIQELAPKRIIAVSCNPSTLARDLNFFLDQYEIRDIQPFDLFPHTPHIECVVKLDRKT